MCFQRSSEGIEGKSRPLQSGWKIVPQSRTGCRETPVAKFVVCSWHWCSGVHLVDGVCQRLNSARSGVQGSQGSVRETDQYIMRASRRRATPGVVDAPWCGVLLWLLGAGRPVTMSPNVWSSTHANVVSFHLVTTAVPVTYHQRDPVLLTTRRAVCKNVPGAYAEFLIGA